MRRVPCLFSIAMASTQAFSTPCVLNPVTGLIVFTMICSFVMIDFFQSIIRSPLVSDNDSALFNILRNSRQQCCRFLVRNYDKSYVTSRLVYAEYPGSDPLISVVILSGVSIHSSQLESDGRVSRLEVTEMWNGL